MISLEAEETYDRMAKGAAWQEQAMFQGRKAFFLFCFFLFVFSRKVTTPEKKTPLHQVSPRWFRKPFLSAFSS
jgi:hypothetical protein